MKVSQGPLLVLLLSLLLVAIIDAAPSPNALADPAKNKIGRPALDLSAEEKRRRRNAQATQYKKKVKENLAQLSKEEREKAEKEVRSKNNLAIKKHRMKKTQAMSASERSIYRKQNIERVKKSQHLKKLELNMMPAEKQAEEKEKARKIAKTAREKGKLKFESLPIEEQKKIREERNKRQREARAKKKSENEPGIETKILGLLPSDSE